MTASDIDVDFLQLPEFLDRATCARIIRELSALTESPAPVYGAGPSSVQAEVRKVSRVQIPESLRDEMKQRFDEMKPRVEEHFRVSLSHCEEPQFLHYRAGDYFVAHQDGNTPLTLDDSRNRKISIVLFLNDEYEGGALLFHGRYPNWQARFPAPASAGHLVAFRSETTHEVTPLAHGHRYTVVSWFR